MSKRGTYEPDKALVEFLDTQKTYSIVSGRTMQPYLEGGMIRIFTKESAAIKAAGDLIEARVMGPNIHSYRSLYTFCLSTGTSSVVIDDNGEEKVLSIRRERDDHTFYNPTLKRVFLKIKQEKRKKDILALTRATYIVPVNISYDGHVPQLLYCYATSAKREEPVAITFTDLDAYNVWSGENDKENAYSPVSVTFDQLRQICRDKGFLINPSGLYLVISREIIEMTVVEKVKKEKEAM